MPYIERLSEVQEHLDEGRIVPGMSKIDVKHVMGKPDAWGATSRKQRVPLIWKYGDVEFGFTPGKEPDQELCMIFIDDGVDGVEEPMFLMTLKDYENK